jgi:serine/threonine protein kinase
MENLEQAQWERLQDLFSKAVDMPASERDAFVSSETSGDPELREELLELLECDSGLATGPLTHALGAALDASSRERRKALVGKIIGNYRVVSVLGHGGTGTVYLAERADRQYSVQVAIKIVEAATVFGDLGARFRAEGQILARLNHPNISALLDAGETNEGQHYLVMEYIHGEQLDRYADRQSLDLRSRLQLFLEICGTVQYAHQNLVVHRDLKPANILVTSYGTPKLLDFGIAKLLEPGDTTAGLALTRMNDRLLTAEYASPEQILGQRVTTASDVYALGVVLYELLTGVRPYSVPAPASQLDLERLICTGDPKRTSTTLRNLILDGTAHGGPDVTAIAHARGLTADKLHKRLLGDLDAIVARALRKEPQQRYTSVEQLAADVRRYLDSKPVQARQSNWVYDSNRFIRRHAFGASAGTIFTAVGIAFVIAMSIQTKRIAAERDRATQESSRAEAVSDFMLQVFSASDPSSSQGHETTARELLDNAGKRIRGDLTQQPEVRVRLLQAIGKTYRRQGQYKQARDVLDEALQLRTLLQDPDASKVSALLLELATVQMAMGDSRSQQTIREAISLLQQSHNEHSSTYAELLRTRGILEHQKADLASAKNDFEKSLALYRDLRGPLHPSVADVLSDLSDVALWEDDLQAAENLNRQAVDIYNQAFPEGHPDRVGAERKLGEILMMEGRTAEAAARLERVLSQAIRLFGENHFQVAQIYLTLADIKAAQGQLDEAENYERRSLSTYRRSIGEEHFQTAFARASLAMILIRRDKLTEAEFLLRGALKNYERVLPPDHQYVASAEYFLGEILLRRGRLSDAEVTLRASMDRWKRTEAPVWRVFRSQSALGEVLCREGKYEDAERYLLESYRALATDRKADQDARIRARERVVRFYQERGEPQKFQALIRTLTARANAQ